MGRAIFIAIVLGLGALLPTGRALAEPLAAKTSVNVLPADGIDDDDHAVPTTETESGVKEGTSLIGPLEMAMLVMGAFLLLVVAALWKLFEKAGRPGWAAIVPLYNGIVFLDVAGRPRWWLLLLLVPGVNFVVVIVALAALARAFGRGAGFAVGLVLLGPIFLPLLAFGDARYTLDSASEVV